MGAACSGHGSSSGCDKGLVSPTCHKMRCRNAPVSDVWADNACMSSLVSHRALQPLPAGELPSWGRVVLVNSPDSWSFQHFTDRAVNVLLQSEGWQQAGTHLVGGRAPTSSQVLGLWHILAEAGGRQEVHRVNLSACWK